MPACKYGYGPQALPLKRVKRSKMVLKRESLLSITLSSARTAIGLAGTIGHKLYPRRGCGWLRCAGICRRGSTALLDRRVTQFGQFGVGTELLLCLVVEEFL